MILTMLVMFEIGKANVSALDSKQNLGGLESAIASVSNFAAWWGDDDYWDDRYYYNYNGIIRKEYELRWTLGTIGISGNLSEKAFNFNTNLGYIIFEEHKTGLGIEIDPLIYGYNSTKEEHALTFLNFNIFWNIMPPGVQHIIGPYFGLQFITYDFTEISLDKRIYTAGLKYSFDSLFWRMWCLEAAYQNIDGKHGAYMGLKIALPLVFLLLLM
jgi:hypothetical protein